MQIKLKTIADDKDSDLIISDDGIDNNNFINLIIDEKEYLLDIKELKASVELFFALKKDKM